MTPVAKSKNHSDSKAATEHFEVLILNDDFVALNKAPGVSVHNEEDQPHQSHQPHLLQLARQQLKRTDVFPVHRLDKETSGVQILAFHQRAARELAQKFESREVSKIYVGVLRGQPEPDQGTWRKSLSDKSEGRRNPAGKSSDQVPCETQFRILKRSNYFTLAEFSLITGRQHQIRKHAALAGHHLVGDARYGDPKYNSRMEQIYQTGRMFLHCQKIGLGDIEVEAPIPQVFSSLLGIC